MQRLLELCEHRRAVVGLAAEHHAVAPVKRIEHGARIAKAAVHDDGKLWERLLQAAHDVVAKRRHLAILFR